MDRSAHTAGDELGGYRIVSLLGSGAAGAVYRAHDGGQNPVALKVLHPAYAATDDARDRLAREVTAMQRLQHPGVARVLDAETDSAEPFLVTELVDGPSLEDEVMGGGPLDAADLFELASRLFYALSAVHEAGLVHRDVKPSNILLGPTGPVLIDFGIAQEVEDSRLTSHGFVMGTPGYLAPEMLEGAAPDAAADWWGWAGSLAFAATGRAPFGVRPLEAVLARVREGAADVAGLGPITREAFTGALRPRAEDRLSPDDVLSLLRDAVAAGEEHVPAQPVTRVLPGGTPEGTALLPARTASAMTRDVPIGTGHAVESDDDAVPALSFDDAAGLEHDEDAYERPVHARRSFALLALAVPTVLAAGLFPIVTAAVVLAVLLVLRTVGVTAQALHGGRERRGVRRSDRIRHAALLPWYLLRAAAGLVPCVLVAASASVMVLGVLWWLLQTDRWLLAPVDSLAARAAGAQQVSVVGTHNADWVFVAALVATAVVALVLLWFGPLTRLTRQGARITLAAVAPGGWGTLGVIVLALALTALFSLWIAVGKAVVWWPFAGPPDLS